MSASVTLRLDTHAPVVTWGPVDGAVASETLSVQYLVNEPGIDHATVELADGRVLGMTVGAGLLSVVLPVDAPEGPATVTAYTLDAVDNAGLATLVVVISGVIGEIPRAPATQGYPPVVEPVVIVDEPSVCTTSSTDRVRATAVRTSTTTEPWSVYRGPGFRTTRTVSTARLSSNDTLRVRAVHLYSPARLSGEDSLFKRPEGPDAEDELAILGLL